MVIVISDASVLIDIECGKLTSAMFSLPWQFAVPDIVFFEELASKHNHLLQLGLVPKKLTGESIAEAYELRQRYLKLSVNDLLSLILAKHENSKLLTGDKALQEVAKQFKLEVHGTVWLVQQIIQQNRITVEDAETAFKLMKKAGSWLPWDLINFKLASYA